MKTSQSKARPVLSGDSDETTKQTPVAESFPQKPVEIGGPKGPEPTRYGDWEKAGRCTDF